MDKPMPDFMFNGMSVILKLRDFFHPRQDVLKEVGIKPGFRVLDYGCGPGGYVIDTARLVGETGTVYALDIHPLAIQRVQNIAKKNHLSNVKTICSDCKTGLPDNSIDVVLLYDIFHMFSDPQAILTELHRVLKPDGILSFNDHHMKQEAILAGVTNSQLFKLSEKEEGTYSFLKQKSPHSVGANKAQGAN
jgi:ubiquinone/menaquinone biosynthesis C-methylase UbiE